MKNDNLRKANEKIRKERGCVYFIRVKGDPAVCRRGLNCVKHWEEVENKRRVGSKKEGNK